MVLCNVPSERYKNRPCWRERDRQWGDETVLCLLDNCLLSAGLRVGNESTPYPCGWSLMRSPEESLDCGRRLVIWWSQVRIDLAEKAERCTCAAKVGKFLKRFYVNCTESQRCPHFWVHTPRRMTDHCFAHSCVPSAQIQKWAQLAQRINKYVS